MTQAPPELSLEEQRTALIARLDDPTLTDEQRTAAVTEAAELAQRIEAHNQAVQAAEAARAGLMSATPAARVTGTPQPASVQPAAPAARYDGGGAQIPQSLGRAVTAAFRQSLGEQMGDNGRMAIAYDGGQRGVRVAPEVEVRSLFATSNDPTNYPRVPGFIQANDRPLQVIDLVDRQPMSSTSIEWVQESTAPIGAAVEVTEGSAKPETTFALTLKTDTAATIAHWVQITRQALDDDNQIRGYVEGRLSYGLMKRLDSQIVNGNGTAPNLRGILNVSGIGTYTAGGATEASVLSIRKAKTVAELSEYEPDSVVLNPVDWEAVELSADTTGQWRLAASAAAGAPFRVWGLAVVSTTAITGTTFGTTGGTFLVGAFKTGATLWERTGVDFFISDSHASNFTSNILVLLAEIRAALTVWRPLAFVKGTFGASRT